MHHQTFAARVVVQVLPFLFVKDLRRYRFGVPGRLPESSFAVLAGCCGEHGSERTKHAADWLLRNFRSLPGNQFEHYANSYNAQGMFQIGGRHWQEYANWMYATYLPKQAPDGSWDSNEAGRVYGTAMMVLAFTVPWRQLPIYQRDETVDEEPSR